MAVSGNSVFYRQVSRNCPLNLGEYAKVRQPQLSWKSTTRRRVSCCTLSSSMALYTVAPPDGYRKSVGICLVHFSKKKIFAASRLHIPDTWEMPQGGADEGEDLRNAAMRELREETSVTSAEFLAETPFWLTYDYPLKVKNKLSRRWGTNYKGQAQKCLPFRISFSIFIILAGYPEIMCIARFLFKFTGKEEEINLLGDGTEVPEFDEWSWMYPEQILELVCSGFQEASL
ncbi:hypothetical protein JRO89_XS12G0124600 [Xanthoceras sorbifolium]|uniref:Nudix hydrolase domain-containing protein n=1 Tax=Xanthoceras sorbifolium TaxID=99658 RepID=A0ABQ8HCE9_9ROSI|nr:hypothetical protein JRO89_XS12G0124600 [Xanthoceras sorbifolium]